MPESNQLVSIIVRTIGRPEVLREAILSIKNQTYRNFEIVVIEDGPDGSSEKLRNEFGNLPLRYISTGEHVGRSRAGNIALEQSKGQFIMFLDDDDGLYPDHLDSLVAALERSPAILAAYAMANEVPTTVLSTSPYTYKESKYRLRYRQDFNRILLMRENYIPIQAMLFRRELYEKYGGFDESLSSLEDWDLWMRFASEHRFEFVQKITSFYRVPAGMGESKERERKIDLAIARIRKKQDSLTVNCTAYECYTATEDIIRHYSFTSFKRCVKMALYRSYQKTFRR